jgi:hypothetical protein
LHAGEPLPAIGVLFANFAKYVVQDSNMVRVGILGATGYTALELIKLLLRHPQVKI